MKRIFRFLILLPALFLIFLLTMCDENSNSNNPDPTPTPGYLEIVCGNVQCDDASTWNDFKILAGAYFTNIGTIPGTGFAWLIIQQPYGFTLASWSQEIYLDPTESIWIDHVFAEPEWNQGTVYCNCNEYY